jgi:hypothetical protein
MDRAYLRARRDISRDNAVRAASASARRAHAELADRYAAQLGEAEVQGTPPSGGSTASG